jgi:hypothetical protein
MQQIYTRSCEHLRSSYNTVTAGSIEQYVYYRIPIRSYSLKVAPEDGHIRSETLSSRYNFVNKLNHISISCI